MHHKKTQAQKLLNWSELSRYLTGDRNKVRPNRENKDYLFINNLLTIIENELSRFNNTLPK